MRILEKSSAEFNIVLIWLVIFTEFSFINYVLLKRHFITGKSAMNNIYYIITLLIIAGIVTSKTSITEKVVSVSLAAVLCYLLNTYF